MPEEGKLGREHRVEMELVDREERDQALSLLLVELLFFEHPDLVVGGVHAPVLDIQVQLRQVEVRPDRGAVENAEALVVTEGDAVGGQPIGDEPFALRLDQRAAARGDRLVELDIHVEVAPLEVDLIEAMVAERALEGLPASGVLVGGHHPATSGATMDGAGFGGLDRLTDRLGGGVGGLAHVVPNPVIQREIIEVVEAAMGGAAKGLEGFERILADLRMAIMQRHGCQRPHRRGRVGAETGELPDRRRRQPANLSRWGDQEADQLRQSVRIGSAAQRQSTLHSCVVLPAIHHAFHVVWRVAAATSRSESAGDATAGLAAGTTMERSRMIRKEFLDYGNREASSGSTPRRH